MTLSPWGWSTAEDVFFSIDSDSAAGNYRKTGFLSTKCVKPGSSTLLMLQPFDHSYSGCADPKAQGTLRGEGGAKAGERCLPLSSAALKNSQQVSKNLRRPSQAMTAAWTGEELTRLCSSSGASGSWLLGEKEPCFFRRVASGRWSCTCRH